MKKHQYHDIDHRGTLHTVEYLTKDAAGNTKNKYCHVYTPYGYDDKKPYDILYVMHGGGGSPDAWLDSCPMKNMLDHTFLNEEAKPMLVVFPTYYKEIRPRKNYVDREYENDCVLFFQKELVEDLIPAVECRFHTYAEHITDETLKATRRHRAFTGFSMGGVTTWYCFQKNLPYFGSFVPLSGDSWIVEPHGGKSKPEETAELVAKIPESFGFGADDFKIFVATGSGDIAYPALNAMMEELKKHTEIFTFSEDYAAGNLHYLLEPDLLHEYPNVYQYLYNFLPYLFE